MSMDTTTHRSSHTPRRRAQAWHAGFTLLELLTAIAILSTVMSIALPALQAARESSRTTTCAANLKQIGIAHAWRPFRAATQLSPVDQGLAVTAEEVYNGQYLRAVTTGKIRMWMTGTKVVRDRIRVPPGTKLLDFIGINYYGRKLIRFTPRTPFVELIEGPGPKTDMGWEIYPQGLRRVLKDAAKYQLPLLISENGLADEHDAQRTEFIRAHLSELRRAQNGGADLLGYMHWSLTDNFEWAEGLSARFGLIDIDYETLTRRERPSFFDFRDLIRAY